jgi:hypothetical protein
MSSTLDPVKVDVINRQPAVVFVYQSKGRASNPSLFAYLEALRHTSNKTGLASPQLANKSNDFAAFQQSTEPASPTHRPEGRTGQDTPRSHQTMSPTSTTIIFLSRFRDRLLKKTRMLRCAQSPRSNVLAKYASARRFFARLASEIFLSSLQTELFS